MINYGVRFESNYGWQDATCQPVTVFFTTGSCFDAIKGAPDLKNVLPRFAVVYDVRAMAERRSSSPRTDTTSRFRWSSSDG